VGTGINAEGDSWTLLRTWRTPGGDGHGTTAVQVITKIRTWTIKGAAAASVGAAGAGLAAGGVRTLAEGGAEEVGKEALLPEGGEAGSAAGIEVPPQRSSRAFFLILVFCKY